VSTRCLIGYVKEDGTIESIYCHHDGYLHGVGKTLQEHYKDLETVKKLMALGDLSSLGETPKSHPELWTLDIITQAKRWGELNKEYCCAYKDRDEDWEDIKPKICENNEEYLRAMSDCWGEYAYLLKDGVWEELTTGMKLIPEGMEEVILEEPSKEDAELKEEMLELAGKLFAEKMRYAVSVGDAIAAVHMQNIKLIDTPNYKGVIDNDVCQEIIGTIVDKLLKRVR